MSEFTILATVSVLLIVASFALRVSSVFVFLGVTTGILLQTHLGEMAGLALGSTFKSVPAELVADLLLLLLPVVFVMVFMRRTMKHHGLFLQILPLIMIGLALPLVMLQIMPVEFQQAVEADQFGSVAVQSADVIIPLAAILNLLLAWRVFGNREPKHHK